MATGEIAFHPNGGSVPNHSLVTYPIEPPGVWIELRVPRYGTPAPGLFLDRDGVVIEERNYVSRPDDAVLMPGAAKLIAEANAAGKPVCVVTNQSGIARGYFGWPEFAAVMDHIDMLLADAGARIDAVAACPFHPQFTPDYGAAHARWRKPGPQMILTLAERLNIDRARSWLIGDQPHDLEAGRAAGLAGQSMYEPTP